MTRRGRRERPTATFKNVGFYNVKTGISVSADWPGHISLEEITAHNTETVFEIRDAAEPKEVAIPSDMLILLKQLALDARNSGLSHQEAAEEIATEPRIKELLKSQGIQAASLTVAVAQLIAQIFLT
jgi:hypothetical protein